MVAATAYQFHKVDPMAGQLLLPYMGWITFAAWLTFTIKALNPGNKVGASVPFHFFHFFSFFFHFFSFFFHFFSHFLCLLLLLYQCPFLGSPRARPVLTMCCPAAWCASLVGRQAGH